MKRTLPKDKDDLEREPKRRKIQVPEQPNQDDTYYSELYRVPTKKTCSICLEDTSEPFIKCLLCSVEGEVGYCKKCVTSCKSCKFERCEECKIQCPTLECEAKICTDCVWGCDGCERFFCGDCVVSCRVCTQRFCKKCVKHKKCECFEVDEEEEEGEEDNDFKPEDESESDIEIEKEE